MTPIQRGIDGRMSYEENLDGNFGVWRSGDISLTCYWENLTREPLNRVVRRVSPYFKDLLEAAKSDNGAFHPIIEGVDSTQTKVHYVFDKTLRQFLGSFHRYGEDPDDLANPFSSRGMRKKFAMVFGEYSVLASWKREGASLRTAMIEYLHKYLPKLEEKWLRICDEHVDEWLEKGEINICEVSALLFSELTLRGFLGYEGEQREIAKLWIDLFRPSDAPLNVAEQKQMEKKGLCSRILGEAWNFCRGVLGAFSKQRILRQAKSLSQSAARMCIEEAKEAENKEFPNFVDFLIQKGFSSAEIEDNFLTLIVAGQETTANLFVYIVEQYINHPEFQKNHGDEAEAYWDEVGSAKEFIDKLEGPKKMYLEAFRLFPPGGSARELRYDSILEWPGGRHYMRQGEVVDLYSAATARDAELFSDPDECDPERRRLDELSHLPFGSGAHVCPGRQAVRPEITAAIGTLLRKAELYRIDAMPGLSGEMMTTFKPSRDFRVGLRKK